MRGAEKREVKIGISNWDFTEVEGLREGEKVIMPSPRIKDGTRVKVRLK